MSILRKMEEEKEENQQKQLAKPSAPIKEKFDLRPCDNQGLRREFLEVNKLLDYSDLDRKVVKICQSYSNINKFYIILKSRKEVKVPAPGATPPQRSPNKNENDKASQHPDRVNKNAPAPATQTVVKDVLDCIPVDIEEPQNNFKTWIQEFINKQIF